GTKGKLAENKRGQHAGLEAEEDEDIGDTGSRRSDRGGHRDNERTGGRSRRRGRGWRTRRRNRSEKDTYTTNAPYDQSGRAQSTEKSVQPAENGTRRVRRRRRTRGGASAARRDPENT